MKHISEAFEAHGERLSVSVCREYGTWRCTLHPSWWWTVKAKAAEDDLAMMKALKRTSRLLNGMAKAVDARIEALSTVTV